MEQLRNHELKALLVREIVEKHYEPGRQDRCRRWVFRNHVVKIYPMSERTFWRYLRMTRPEPKPTADKTDKNQLKLFDYE